MGRPRRITPPQVPHGLLSAAGLVWLVGFLAAGVWVLAGFGWASVASAVTGCAAFVLADALRDPVDPRRPGGRR